MNADTLDEINSLLEISTRYRDVYRIACVLNVKGMTDPGSNYSASPVETEYFSKEQYGEIRDALIWSGHQFDIFVDEDDFAKRAESLSKERTWRTVVLNFAQKGIGSARKSLVPALCDMYGLPYAGSNAFISSLCRYKTVWHPFLRELGYSVCDSWIVDPANGWVNGRPPEGHKIIVKVDGETSSIGLSSSNDVLLFSSEANEYILDKANQFDRRLLVESFVPGYEVEVPLLNNAGASYCLGVAGISYKESGKLGDRILDYDIRGNNKFGFYDFSETNKELALKIEADARACSLAFGLDGYCRVDYRVNDEGRYFITDISSTPHLTKSMTYAFLFDQNNLPYEVIYKALIGHGIRKAEIR